MTIKPRSHCLHIIQKRICKQIRTRVTAIGGLRVRHGNAFKGKLSTQHSNYGYCGDSCLQTVFCMMYEQRDPGFSLSVPGVGGALSSGGASGRVLYATSDHCLFVTLRAYHFSPTRIQSLCAELSGSPRGGSVLYCTFHPSLFSALFLHHLFLLLPFLPLPPLSAPRDF